jgi:hypothetical protein
MTNYVELPIETDTGVLTQEAFDYLQTRIPGWLPSEGNLDVWMLEAFAQIAAEVRDVASDVPVSIFKYFGQNIILLPPIQATSAQLLSTWQVRDAIGYTIPQGAQVGVRGTDGTIEAFFVQAPVTIPPGSTATANGGVVLVASDPGVGLSGYTPPTGALTMIDNLEYVSGVQAYGAVGGGVEAESDDSYISRLSAELQLLTPRPIIPSDFAVLATSIAGVDRALGIDGYNPADQSSGNARMVAVAVIDSAGNNLASGVKAQVDALLQGMREVSFIVNVVDPTRTAVNVTATVKVVTGMDTQDVDDRVTAAVTAYLQPYNWGLPLMGDTPPWVQQATVRYLDIANIILGTQGVWYIVSMTLNGGTSDVGLSGVAPLTTPGTIAITATP